MSFIPGEIYHVYNRGNNQELIFREEENYFFFIKKIEKELMGCCDLLAYALLPNHYHLLLYVPEELKSSANMPLISRKLGTLQSSYTQAYNKRFGRTGALFQPKLKRKLATDYADVCLHYIHQNPMKAGLAKTLKDWPFSSYDQYLILKDRGMINRELAYRLLDIPKDPVMFETESYGVINNPRLDYLQP